ncbi:MAG: hypothetical protein RIS65_1278 [Pseudomonadota bacterium]
MRLLHVIQIQADCFTDWLAANRCSAINTKRWRYARFDRRHMGCRLDDNGVLVRMEVIHGPLGALVSLTVTINSAISFE